jgi:hypothetical protein
MMSTLYDRKAEVRGLEAESHGVTPYRFLLPTRNFRSRNYEAPATLGRSRIGAGASGRRGGRGFRIAKAHAATHWGEWPNLVNKEPGSAGILPAQFCLSKLTRIRRHRPAPHCPRPGTISCL